jgi:hypothetical protein
MTKSSPVVLAPTVPLEVAQSTRPCQLPHGPGPLRVRSSKPHPAMLEEAGLEGAGSRRHGGQLEVSAGGYRVAWDLHSGAARELAVTVAGPPIHDPPTRTRRLPRSLAVTVPASASGPGPGPGHCNSGPSNLNEAALFAK